MCHLIHKSAVCILNIFSPTPCFIFSSHSICCPLAKVHHLRVEWLGMSLQISGLFTQSQTEEIQKPRFQFPLKFHRVTAIHPIYYKFIAAISRLSLKGLLNFNWNEEVKTPSSFLKDKAMHFSGLGLHQTHATTLRVSFQSINVLEQFSGSASNFEWQMQNYTIGEKGLSSQNIESNDSF